MESKEIIVLIEELYKKTVENKVQWNSINPVAFRWIKQKNEQELLIVTLQKQPTGNPSVRDNYVLTIQIQKPQNPQPIQPAIQINSISDVAYRESLEQLFKGAEKSANENTMQTLKDLLTGL